MKTHRRDFLRKISSVAALAATGSVSKLDAEVATINTSSFTATYGDPELRGLRDQFPLLGERVNGHPLVYLDSAATSQRPRAVLEALTNFYLHDNANPSTSLHTLAGRAATLYEKAKETVAQFVHARGPQEIVWTRGTTEAINLVAASWGGANLRSGDEIILTVSEHYSSLVPWQLAAKRANAHVRFVDVEEGGRVLPPIPPSIHDRSFTNCHLDDMNTYGWRKSQGYLLPRSRFLWALPLIVFQRHTPERNEFARPGPYKQPPPISKTLDASILEIESQAKRVGNKDTDGDDAVGQREGAPEIRKMNEVLKRQVEALREQMHRIHDHLHPIESIARGLQFSSSKGAAMKAIQIKQYGGEEQLELVDAPKPQAGKGQLVVRIAATSFKPIDPKRASGDMREVFPLQFPFIPGGDFSGVVDSVEEGVEEFKPGDEVFGYSMAGGAYAEFIAIGGDKVALKPKSLNHIEAASLALVAQTALQMLDRADVQKGQTILIQGAGGSVGGVAVQIAHRRGIKVFGTASAARLDRVKGYGADRVIDYQAAPFENSLKDVDAVLDTVGGEVQQRSYGVLKPGGTLVAINQPPSEEQAAKHKVKASMLVTEVSTASLQTVARLADAGKVKPFIGKIYPFSDIARAWADARTMHIDGKTVFAVGAAASANSRSAASVGR